MAKTPRAGLNESGEMLLTRIVRGAALHVSRGEHTLPHAHYAWKIHVGLDAPVWLQSEPFTLDSASAARVVVVPPGLHHSVGSVGWSCTVLVAPGTRALPWGPVVAPSALHGAQARALITACGAGNLAARQDTSELVNELLRLACPSLGNFGIDARVRRALHSFGQAPAVTPKALASELRLSVDRLSHLVVRDTGTPLRRHLLWSRLLRLLSSNKHYLNIAAAAADAGFSDHAHMTRTYRALIGRLPSEFTAPPDTLEPW